ncbi:MAG: FliM/FliN family flagellar motor switch protein [Candidatus Hydrogenedentes bacterium]|nr:FliM/FliN family flagellar motor switch protein [Candidatus Hydrogenedentota bacterium]
MSSSDEHSARDHEFKEVPSPKGTPAQHLELEDLREVKLSLTAELGRCTMRVGDILNLERGSVVQLDKVAGEMVNLIVNDVLLGKGEIAVIGDGLHIRVSEIIGAGELPGAAAVEK